MAKIKRTVSAILAVLMAASMLTTASVSAATEDASNVGATASFSESVTNFSEETTIETEAETEEVTEAQKTQNVKEEEEAVGAATDISGGTVTLAATSYTYSGAAKKPGVTVKYGTKTLTSGTDYTVAYSNNTNVGTATVTVTGKGSYKGTKIATFKIKAKKLTDSAVTLKSDKVEFCAGNKATVVVKDGTKTLVNGTDYSLTYDSDLIAGSNANVKVTFKGNYTGTVTKSYMVVEKPISKCTISFNKSSYSYDAKEAISATVKNGSLVLKEGRDYSIQIYDYWQVGTVKVSIYGTGNYSGMIEKPITITQADIAKTDIKVSTASNCLYENGVIKSLITVKDNYGFYLKRNRDYTVSFDDDEEDGIVTYTVKGIGDYTGTYYGSYLSDEDSKYFATRFVWGRDNWSFDNSSAHFVNDYKVNDTVKTGLMKDFKMNQSDKNLITNAINQNLKFEGACYGMSSSAVVLRGKYINLSKYTQKTQTHQVESSNNGTDICSFFHNSWYTRFGYLPIAASHSGKTLSYIENNAKSQKEYVTRFEKALKNQNEVFQLIFRIEKGLNGGHVYHAVVIYGTEKFDYTHRFPDGTTKKYDKRFLIYDPNHGELNTIYDNSCVYYNSKDGSWIIPSWTWDLSYESGGYCCYWNAEMGKDLSRGSLSAAIKYYSVTCCQDVMSGYKFDYTKDVWDGSEVGADENELNDGDSYTMEWADQNNITDNDAPFVNIGDVNCDGSMSINDVTALQNYLADISGLSSLQKLSADVNGDGEVTIADAYTLQLMIAELA